MGLRSILYTITAGSMCGVVQSFNGIVGDPSAAFAPSTSLRGRGTRPAPQLQVIQPSQHAFGSSSTLPDGHGYSAGRFFGLAVFAMSTYVASQNRKRRSVQLFGMRGGKETIQLTGNTLKAALKMRCDLTDATYSIFWLKVDDVFAVSGNYDTVTNIERLRARKGRLYQDSFAKRCSALLMGNKSLVFRVARSERGAFVPDAKVSKGFPRNALAKEFDVGSVCLAPFQDGVLEYGTHEVWKQPPAMPRMPIAQMNTAYQAVGASYTLFWTQAGDKFNCVSDFVTAARKKALRIRRGDDLTFASESLKTTIGMQSMVGRVQNLGKNGDFEQLKDATSDEKFTRRDLAKEFGVKQIRMVKCTSGVLEYGVPTELQLAGNTLDAVMKWTCDLSGAVYAIYWVPVEGQFVVSGDYVTPERRLQVKKLRPDGKTFAGICESLKLGPDSLIARVFKTDKNEFILDAANNTAFTRAELAGEFLLNSIAFMPVQGGVLEFGTTAAWSAFPKFPEIPRGDMKKAFDAYGATYCMLWTPGEMGFWNITAEFVTAERRTALRNVRGDDKTFAMASRAVQMGPESNIAKTAKGTSLVRINDADKDPNFLRRPMAKEFGVKCIRLLPCAAGLLEYGAGVIRDSDSQVPDEDYWEDIY